MLLFLTGLLFSQPSHALGEPCYGAAAARVEAFGGTDLRLETNSVTGFYVNASGYVSYTYRRGDLECYLSFYMKGTYLGELCEDPFGRDDGTPVCRRPRGR